MNIPRYIWARLKEPSTHAGIAALFGFLAVIYPQHKDVFVAATALFGSIAAAAPDTTSTATDAPAPAIAAEVEKPTA